MSTQTTHSGSLEDSDALSNIDSKQPDGSDIGLSLDQIFDLLSNSRRRTVLQVLESRDEPVPFGDLVDAVAQDEYGKPLQEISGQERRTIYSSLYQSHLPRLERMDVVAYREVSGAIHTGPPFDDLREFLDQLDDDPTLADRVLSLAGLR